MKKIEKFITRVLINIKSLLIVIIVFSNNLLGQNGFVIDYNNGELSRIDLNNPTDEIFIGTTTQFIGDAEFGANNLLYALPKSGNQFYQIDTTNATMVQVGTSNSQDGHDWSGLAYDVTTGNLYASSTTGNTESAFYTIDISTGAASHIGTTTIAQTVADIAFDDSGQMYAYNLSNSIYLIDKTNGTATLLGNTGHNAAGPWHGLDYSFHNNTMYMSTYNSITWEKTIRSVNLVTGVTTSVGNINHLTGGFAITHPEADQIPGDLNSDGDVNILDIVELVDIILGLSQYNSVGDLNSDGLINVIDVVLVIEIILA